MSRTSALNVSLTPPLKRYVQQKVDTGRYESASEVVREGLRALQEREAASAAYWADIRQQVAVARAQVKAGDLVDGEVAFDELLQEFSDSNPKKRSAKSRASKARP